MLLRHGYELYDIFLSILCPFLFPLNFYFQATYYVLPTTEKFYPKCIRSTLKKFNVVGDTNIQMVWFLHFLLHLSHVLLHNLHCLPFFPLYYWTWHSFLYGLWPYFLNFNYVFRNPVKSSFVVQYIVLSHAPLKWLPNYKYLWNWNKIPKFNILDRPLTLSKFQ